MAAPSIFDRSEAYKPFAFPWGYEYFKQSEEMHWLAGEVPLNDDVKDWQTNTTDAEKALLTQIFRLFTQTDADVASAYVDVYMPKIKRNELRMAMTSIAAREAVHMQAYSMLVDELGLPETEYAAFLQYEEMKAKHEFLMEERGDSLEAFAQNMAIFSAFGEGMQLFASFVMLLSFTRFGRYKGMGQIVAWSIRDESLHVEFMIKVFHQLLDEHPELWNDDFKRTIYQTARDMVAMEDKFIDLVFSNTEFGGSIEGLTADDVKQYIRFIADRRLLQLGLKANYGVSKNPLPWVDVIVNGKEHMNFFEGRATDYSKGAIEGNWDDAFKMDDFGFDVVGPQPTLDIEALAPHPEVNDFIAYTPDSVLPQALLDLKTVDGLTYTYESSTPEPVTLLDDVGGYTKVDIFDFSDAALMASDDWLVITKAECGWCVKAKKLLADQGIAYREEVLETEEQKVEFRKRHNPATVPQVYKNGKLIGTYEKLSAFFAPPVK